MGQCVTSSRFQIVSILKQVCLAALLIPFSLTLLRFWVELAVILVGVLGYAE